MAKKPKKITPFFVLRFQVNDTLERLANELVMTMQAIETVVQFGDMNAAAKSILTERASALKAVCLVDEPQS